MKKFVISESTPITIGLLLAMSAAVGGLARLWFQGEAHASKINRLEAKQIVLYRICYDQQRIMEKLGIPPESRRDPCDPEAYLK